MRVSTLRAIFFILIVSSTAFYADRITVHNKTPRDLFIAIYYLDSKGKAVLATPVQLLESDSSGNLERPARKWGYDRQLVFVEYQDMLQKELTEQQINKEYHSLNVGNLQGDVFYIADKEDGYYGFTTVQWNASRAVLMEAREALIKRVPVLLQNPNQGKSASVRKGNDLSQGEREFLQRRAPVVQQQIEKLVGTSLAGKKLPTVALVCSGGGYRAMLYTMGALLGAERTGILNSTTYLVGLSGSTWAIGGWVLSGKNLGPYHDWLINNISHGLRNISSNDGSLIGEYLIAKYFTDQPIDVVDLYGCLLANELLAEFKHLKQRQTLSSQIDRIQNGAIPFPIYTAIAAEDTESEKLWYEFNPYEVGAAWLGLYVPSNFFGNKFKGGVSVTSGPEQNFGVLMGTFGLAIGITIDRLLQETQLYEKVGFAVAQNIIKRIIQHVGHKRVVSSDFFNFSYQMAGYPLVNNRLLKFVDAGINFNLPYPPISGQRPERKADIIIFVDASGDNLSLDLRKAEEYAKRHNLKFPAINYTDIEKHAVSMFIDEKDPSVPAVLYIPRIVDPTFFTNASLQEFLKDFEQLRNFNIEECIAAGACSTFNFKYTAQQAHKLTQLGTFNMLAAKEYFVRALNFKITGKVR